MNDRLARGYSGIRDSVARLIRPTSIVALAGFLFTVVVGALPELIPYGTGQPGQVWTPLNSSRFRVGDGYYYASWTAEIAEGKFPPRNPANSESQDSFGIELFKIVPQALSALPALAFSDNRWVYLTSLTVFPGLIFLLAYRLGRLFDVGRVGSLWIGLAIVFYLGAGERFLGAPTFGAAAKVVGGEPWRLLSPNLLDYDLINDNFRFMIPPISVCVQLIFLLNLIQLERRPGWLRALTCTILLAALAFTYLPAAMICYLVGAGIFCLCLWKGRWRPLLFIGGASMAAGALLLIIDYPGLLQQGKSNTAFWSAVFENTDPSWDTPLFVSYVSNISLLLVLAFPGCRHNKDLRRYHLVLSAIALGIIAWTALKHDLLIFSKLFWRGVFHLWLISILVSLAQAKHLVPEHLRRLYPNRLRAAQIVVHTVFVMVFLVVPAVGFGRLGDQNARSPARFIPAGQWDAYRWLRENTPSNSVVLAADWDDIYLIPIYTRNNLFFGHMQISNRSPRDEVSHFLAAWQMLDRSRQELSELVGNSVRSANQVHPRFPTFASPEIAESSGFALDVLYWPYVPRCVDLAISTPDHAVTNPAFQQAVMSWYDESDSTALLSRRDCDYVLVSRHYFDRLPGLTPERGFTLIYENDLRRIYRVDKPRLLESLAAEIRIVTLGDSITQGVREGVERRETFSALLEAELRAAGTAAEVINAGVGGETSGQGLRRLPQVIRCRPDIVVCMFGTNDSYIYSGKTEPAVPLQDYRANLREIVRQSNDAGIRVVLMTPPRWMANALPDGRGLNPNVALRPYVDTCREVAYELQVPLIDHYEHWSKVAEAANSSPNWTTDGCHPNPTGHREMLHLMKPALKRLASESKRNRPRDVRLRDDLPGVLPAQ